MPHGIALSNSSLEASTVSYTATTEPYFAMTSDTSMNGCSRGIECDFTPECDCGYEYDSANVFDEWLIAPADFGEIINSTEVDELGETTFPAMAIGIDLHQNIINLKNHLAPQISLSLFFAFYPSSSIVLSSCYL